MSRTPPLILMADDDALSVLVVEELLTRAGYTTLTCSSGREAYSLACQVRPDLIILDVHMEDRYIGVGTLKQLRATPATLDIPVILSSADTQALDTLQHYLQTFHCEILVKPIEFDVLLGLVRRAARNEPRL
jgi:twitching motility two-component system response regulator PilH